MGVSKGESFPDRGITRLADAAIAGVHTGDDSNRALREGEKLFEFELIRVIGVGGFGIVYLAHDHALQRDVAIKEYMPVSLAERAGQTQVAVRSRRHAESFETGMRSFINEARLLAQFDHPSLVKVYRFWEANGTAYMVMPFYEGATLKQHLSQTAAPDEAWLQNLLAPLLDALDTLHQQQCFHRDISPDNIIILQDGRPLLLDFGAARRAISGIDQSFTVILKPGYAPIEQYADDPSMRQGPWTDLYALASVVQFAITGQPPSPSVNRVVSEPQLPLAQTAAGRYSERFLCAIDQCLAVMPRDRPQGVAALRMQLDLPAMTTKPLLPAPPPRPGPTAAILPATVPGSRRPRSMLLALLALSLALAGAYLVDRAGQVAAPPPAPVDVPTAVLDAPRPNDLRPRPEAAFASDHPVPETSTPTPAEMLDQIFAARDPKHEVEARLARSEVRIGIDSLHMTITSSRFGYVYLFMVGSNGSDFHLLFPNAIDRNNWIAPSRAIGLPRRGWDLRAFGPAGTDQFVAIVSESRRHFRETGLRQDDLFSNFPPESLHHATPPAQGVAPVFAGRPDCSHLADPCTSTYGAARFSILEVQKP